MKLKLCNISLILFVSLSLKVLSVFAFLKYISKPTMYKWNEKILSRIPNETSLEYYSDCGGIITKGPGTIEQFFVSRNPSRNVRCTWRIHAPNKHHVYVKQLRLTHTTLHNQQSRKFDDAPFIEIFDGTMANEKSLLYRFGDETLNNCLSSGSDMIIQLRYNETGKYIDQQAVIKYGFIEKIKITDLL